MPNRPSDCLDFKHNVPCTSSIPAQPNSFQAVQLQQLSDVGLRHPAVLFSSGVLAKQILPHMISNFGASKKYVPSAKDQILSRQAFLYGDPSFLECM